LVIDSKMENQDWVKSFRNKLWKILTTAPIYIDMVLSPDKVELTLPSENKVKSFTIDFNRSIQDNLFGIKSWVVFNWCPKMATTVSFERSPTPGEILEKIENGSLGDPYKLIVEEEVVTTYIEKITPKTSIVIVSGEDLAKEKTVFKMNYPIVKFLKISKDMSPEERRDFFMEKTTFLYQTKPQDLKETN